MAEAKGMTRATLQQARELARDMSDSYDEPSAYVHATECPCDCHGTLDFPERERFIIPPCENCSPPRPFDDATDDGKCYGGWTFTRHDSREE
jgi:hypothetical protein